MICRQVVTKNKVYLGKTRLNAVLCFVLRSRPLHLKRAAKGWTLYFCRSLGSSIRDFQGKTGSQYSRVPLLRTQSRYFTARLSVVADLMAQVSVLT